MHQFKGGVSQVCVSPKSGSVLLLHGLETDGAQLTVIVSLLDSDELLSVFNFFREPLAILMSINFEDRVVLCVQEVKCVNPLFTRSDLDRFNGPIVWERE